VEGRGKRQKKKGKKRMEKEETQYPSVQEQKG
jgi:hypothetical protein